MNETQIITLGENHNKWSAELQAKTRRELGDLAVHIFMNRNRCHLKNSRFEDDRAYGFVTLQNALQEDLIVESEDYPEKMHYADVDSLVNDGWVLD